MLFAAILAIGAAFAQTEDYDYDYGDRDNTLGAGLVVGDTTGVSLGWRPNEWNAAEVGLGYDVLDGGLKGTADYLRSIAVIDPNPRYRIPIYVGLGAGIGRDTGQRQDIDDRVPVAIDAPGIEEPSRNDLTARVPVGASILFTETPIEIFAHAVPGLRVLPTRELEVDGSLGFRYYF